MIASCHSFPFFFYSTAKTWQRHKHNKRCKRQNQGGNTCTRKAIGSTGKQEDKQRKTHNTTQDGKGKPISFDRFQPRRGIGIGQPMGLERRWWDEICLWDWYLIWMINSCLWRLPLFCSDDHVTKACSFDRPNQEPSKDWPLNVSINCNLLLR